MSEMICLKRFDYKREKEDGSKLRIAALAPHADDIELGCGATLARLIDQYEVDLNYYVFLCRKRTLSGENINGKEELRLSHSKQSFKFLTTGICILNNEEKEKDIFFTNNNKFQFIRSCSNQELYLNKEKIFDIIRNLYVQEIHKADMIFIPSFHDSHHDHRVLSDICSQIFRGAENVLHYSAPESRIYPYDRFNPNIYIDCSIPIKNNGVYSNFFKQDSVVDYSDIKLYLLSLFKTETTSRWYNEDLFLTMMKRNAYESRMNMADKHVTKAEAFEGILRI